MFVYFRRPLLGLINTHAWKQPTVEKSSVHTLAARFTTKLCTSFWRHGTPLVF